MVSAALYVLSAAIFFLGAVQVLIVILPALLLNQKAPVTSEGGTSLVRSSSNGQAVLYSLGATEGYGYVEDGTSLDFTPVGWQSDLDRVAVVASQGLDSISILNAEYRISHLTSTAGTPLFETKYRIYFGAFGTPNITSVITIIFSLPDSFLSKSPATDDGNTVNISPVFMASCGGANNVDGLPLTILSYVYAFDSTGFGYPNGPILFVRYNYDPYSIYGAGIQCDIDFIAPLP